MDSQTYEEITLRILVGLLSNPEWTSYAAHGELVDAAMDIADIFTSNMQAMREKRND